MSSTIFTILSIVLVGLATVKTTSGQDDLSDRLKALQESLNKAFEELASRIADAMETITKLTSQITDLLQTIINPPKVVSPCGGVLTNGKQYYLRSLQNRYVVVDGNQWGLLKVNSQTGASRFTAVEKGCNVYALSVDGKFMSRCERCSPPTGGYQSVKFHATDSTESWSHWTITNKEGTVGGPYNLRSDLSQYFLTFKSLPRGPGPHPPKEPDQLNLSNVIDEAKSWFEFVEVPPSCGLLQNGDRYYLQDGDGRYAILNLQNPESQNLSLAFMQNVDIERASPFTVKEYACGYYGLCSRGVCLSRCELCKTPTGDFNSVTFHVTNSDGDFSQWAVSLTGRAKPYKYYLNVKDMVNPKGYLSYKLNPDNKYQVTISTNSTSITTMFDLIPAVI